MKQFINRREIRKRIIAVADKNRGINGYVVKHDIPGEAIICQVPTLDIAGTIVKALRERAELKIAQALLHEHEQRKKSKYRRQP